MTGQSDPEPTFDHIVIGKPNNTLSAALSNLIQQAELPPDLGQSFWVAI